MEAKELVKDPKKVALGAAIQRWRMEKGMSRLELSRLVNMSKPAICLIENGYRAPALRRHGDFATALDKDPEDLIKAAYDVN